MRWWAAGGKGEMPEEAKTGYALLDARTPPSTLGRALRVTAHHIVNKTPDWEGHHASRRLDAAIAAPNPRATGPMRLPHWSEAYTAFRDPDRPAASEKLAELMSTRASHGRMRRLGEAFFTGTLAVPYAARTTATTWGTYEASTGANWFTSGLRYLIYGESSPVVKRSASYLTFGVFARRHCALLLVPGVCDAGGRGEHEPALHRKR